VLVGRTKNKNNPDFDSYILNLSKSYELIAEQWYGGVNNKDDEATSVSILNDNKIIFSGITNSFGSGGADIDIAVAENPSLSYYKGTSYGGENHDKSYKIKILNDSNYIFLGSTFSFGEKYSDLLILRLHNVDSFPYFFNLHKDRTDKITTNTTIIPYKSYVIKISPNPLKESLLIEGIEGNFEYNILNSQGKVMITNQSINSTLDFIGFNNGIYFLNIFYRDKWYRFKILKVN
jgi:hypothetical protein